MAPWIHDHRALLNHITDAAPLARRLLANIPATSAGVAGAIAFLFLIVLAVTIAFARFLKFPAKSRFAVYLYAALLAAFLVHIFAHVMLAIALGMYTPGVVSAVLVVPPVGGYLYWLLLRHRLLSAKSAAISAVAGVLSVLPVLLSAHFVGRRLFD